MVSGIGMSALEEFRQNFVIWLFEKNGSIQVKLSIMFLDL